MAEGGRVKVDILYLAHGREEFTRASLDALARNTNPELVGYFVIYTDGGLGPVFNDAMNEFSWVIVRERMGGPVPIMNDFLAGKRPYVGADCPVFAKIDNDVIVPPGWLDQCVATMERFGGLDLLGIEPPLSRTANPATGKTGPRPELIAPEGQAAIRTDCVGGIGLFARSAFGGRPLTPHSGGRGGFTDWQLKHPEVTKGWIVPPLKLFLLDRLISEPWASLSRKYEAEGIQRPWTRYTEAEQEALAGWWLDGQK